MATQATERSEAAVCEIHPFDAGRDDRAGALDLYEQVFDGGSPAWFDWKYVEDPYPDHVPIVLALHDGRVVGVKAAMPFELVTGEGGTLPALDGVHDPDGWALRGLEQDTR